jgi:hypothetical protein
MPLPLARWERAVFAERKDWVSIKSGRDIEEIKSDQERANEFAHRMKTDPEFAAAFLRGEVKA